MKIKNVLSAATLVVVLGTAGAQAGMEPIVTSSSGNSTLLIGALVIGVLGFLALTSGGGGDSLSISTKNDEGLDRALEAARSQQTSTDF